MSRRRLAAALALACFVGCRGPEQRALEHLAAGDEHLASGALEEARREYDAASRLAPGLVAVGLRQVAVLDAEGRYEEALELIRRVGEDSPASSEVAGLWGTILRRLGRLEAAERQYRRAVELDPDSPHALTDHAGLLAELGEVDRALDLYERASRTAGTLPPGALMAWADALSAAGREPEALRRLEAAHAIAAGTPGLARRLGVLLIPRQPARAAGLLEAAMAAEGGDAELLAALGAAYHEAGRLYEGRNLLRRALALTGSAARREKLEDRIAAIDALQSAGQPPPDAPNVLMVVVDTLRADRVGAYGHDRRTTARLDELAASGVVFENAWSQAPWTAASIATLLTGLYPSVHGIDGGVLWTGSTGEASPLPFATQRTLAASQTTLAEHLRRSGYRTAGFVSNVYANSIFGFAQGFETFHDDHEDYSSDILRLKRRASETNGLVLDWIEKDLEEPFFLLVHYNDPHWPYDPPGSFGSAWLGERTRDAAGREHLNSRIHSAAAAPEEPRPEERAQLLALYDGEIAYADHHLGAVIDALARRRSPRSLLTVVTADHGEEFYEHGSTSHGFTLYEEQLRVPLVFHWPGRLQPRRVAGLVGLVDVTPTILELLGIDTDAAAFQGRSLAAALDGGTHEGGRVFAEAAYRGDRRSVRTADLKLIESRDPPQLELFDLVEDPAELHDLSTTKPDGVARLRGLVRAWEERNRVVRADLSGPVPSLRLDESTRERLRALGYVR